MDRSRGGGERYQTRGERGGKGGDKGKGKGGETEAEKKEKTRLFRPEACPLESLDGIVALTTADANVQIHGSPQFLKNLCLQQRRISSVG